MFGVDLGTRPTAVVLRAIGWASSRCFMPCATAWLSSASEAKALLPPAAAAVRPFGMGRAAAFPIHRRRADALREVRRLLGIICDGAGGLPSTAGGIWRNGARA